MGSNKNWDSINVTLLRNNNQNEITRFYNVFKPFFLNFLKHNEELYNDLIVLVLKELPSFKEESKFSTWVYTLAKNLSLAFEKKKKREQQKQKQKLINKAFEQTINEAYSIDDKEELEVLISKLQPSQRIFLESYIKDKTKYTKQRSTYTYTINVLLKYKSQLAA